MKGKTKFGRQHVITLQYLLSYLAMVLIALACTGYAYFGAQRILESNIEQFNLKTMAGIRDLVDGRLAEMDGTINRVAAYHKTNQMLNMANPFGTPQMFSLKEYGDYLTNIEAQNSPAYYLVVYACKSGYVFYNHSAAQYPAYVKETFPTGGEEAEARWLEQFSTPGAPALRPAETVTVSGIRQRVVPYIQTLPLGSRQALGAICIYITHDSLFAGLVEAGDFNTCYVLGPGQQLITSFGPAGPAGMADPADFHLDAGELEGFYTQELGGEQMIVAYVRSQQYGLTFVSVTPYSTVMQQASSLRQVFILTIVLCVLLGVLVAALMVRRNAAPIAAVYRMLSDQIGGDADGGSNLDYIRRSVSRLLQDNTQLQEIMARQSGEMQVAYLSRLLTGSFETGREMQSSVLYTGLRTQNRVYIVVTVRMLNYGDLSQRESIAELHVIKARMRQTLEPAKNHVVVVDTAANQLALVFHFENDGSSYYRDYIQLLVADLKDLMAEHDIAFKAAAGSPRTQLTDLYHSYREANLTAGSHGNRGDVPLHWYQDAGGEPNSIFHYPDEIRQRVIAYTRGGEVLVLAELLDAVAHENFENLRISDAMGNLLLAELRATLLKYAREHYTDEPDTMARLAAEHSAPSVLPTPAAFDELKDRFLRLCEESALRKTNRNQILRQNILDYIDANYTNPDISLAMLAREFGLSESYFSTFFKKQTGVNYVGYLAAKRLGQAQMLLRQNRHTVEEIARMVGYTTAHSFRRAYKKLYGTNPIDHKKADD